MHPEGEKNLKKILKNLNPVLNEGEYVYCQTGQLNSIPLSDVLFFFRENEAFTIVMKKEDAERHSLNFQYTAAWITFEVQSSLDAVGMTAAFSNALGNDGISCNVVAAYYHDHIFVDLKDAKQALRVLKSFQS
ncbi:ACT domain-containing protein [Flavobacterium sp.]|uniref:ACT domain-containing protein n=1 Tax=Flavobacterium sp. TaxID=239 RepID=UPI002EDB9342